MTFAWIAAVAGTCGALASGIVLLAMTAGSADGPVPFLLSNWGSILWVFLTAYAVVVLVVTTITAIAERGRRATLRDSPGRRYSIRLLGAQYATSLVAFLALWVGGVQIRFASFGSFPIGISPTTLTAGVFSLLGLVGYAVVLLVSGRQRGGGFDDGSQGLELQLLQEIIQLLRNRPIATGAGPGRVAQELEPILERIEKGQGALVAIAQRIQTEFTQLRETIFEMRSGSVPTSGHLSSSDLGDIIGEIRDAIAAIGVLNRNLEELRSVPIGTDLARAEDTHPTSASQTDLSTELQELLREVRQTSR